MELLLEPKFPLKSRFVFFEILNLPPMGEFLQLHFKQVFCLATTFEGELSIGSESVSVCV